MFIDESGSPVHKDFHIMALCSWYFTFIAVVNLKVHP